MTRQIVVEFLGDSRNFNKATNDAINHADKMTVSGNSLVKMGAALNLGAKITAGGLGLLDSALEAGVDFMFDSIDAASNLNEAMALSQQVFEENQSAVDEWAQSGAENFGMSEREALEMASGFGTAFKNVGLSLDETSDKSENLTELAADLGSAFNASSDEAATALRSGLLGESEPLRKFGVFLDAAKVKAKALDMGMKPLNGTFTDAQLVTARYQIILEQTADSQGMFGRDTDSLADSQKQLDAAMENLSASIGEVLVPAMTEFVKYVNSDVVPAVSEAVDWFKENKDVLDALGMAFAFLKDGPIKGFEAGMETANERTAEATVAALMLKEDGVEPLTDSFDRATGYIDRFDGPVDDSTTAIQDLTAATKPAVDELRNLRDAVRSAMDQIIEDKYEPEELAEKLWLARDAVRDLTAREQELAAIKDPTAAEREDLHNTRLELIEAKKDVDRLTVDTRTLDKTSVARITAHMNSLGKKIDWTSDEAAYLLRLLRDIDRAESQVNWQGANDPGGFGGKAMGGPASGLTWVGEKGPELVDLPGNSYVYTNPESMRMAKGQVTGTRYDMAGGGGDVHLHIGTFIGSGPDIDRLANLIARRMQLAGV